MLRDRLLAEPRKPPTFEVKPVLDVTVVPVFRVHYTKLQEYLKRVYRTEEFDFLLAAGVTPGPVVEFDATGKIPNTLDYRDRVIRIRSGKRITRHPGLVLDLLVREGFIPAGRYLIETKDPPDATKLYRRLLADKVNPDDPACVAFRRQHAKDRTFVEHAKVLDAQVREYLESHKEPA